MSTLVFTYFSRTSILEFGRGAYNQVVAPGITRPLHVLLHKVCICLFNTKSDLVSAGTQTRWILEVQFCHAKWNGWPAKRKLQQHDVSRF